MSVELALGTVQFGTAYGVAGRGEAVPEREVRALLAMAWEAGIRLLDTAPGYGDIEQRLDRLAGELRFAVVSKVPALPRDASNAQVSELVASSIGRSLERLAGRLEVVLFHRGEDLLERHGEVAWQAAHAAVAKAGVRLGASCYAPEVAVAIRQRFAAPVLQLPGNALDQRLARPEVVAALRGVEVHLRSVFLQGLLLMPTARAVARIPASAAALAAWHRWCADRSVEPLQAALGVAKSLPNVRYCLVGVDRCEQLEAIIAAWRQAQPQRSEAIATEDADVIDPRSWSAA
jgi:aryl-alcohol dehydrogenase-like predicted oxidoreductase